MICAGSRCSSNTRVLDHSEFRGDVYAIYPEVMAHFLAQLNSAPIHNSQGRDDRLGLPESALQEASDTAVAGLGFRNITNVRAYIDKDRVEVVTPGGLGDR